VSDISGKADISGQVFTGDIAAPKITASTGILFGTDTAAANTLDDYEEGTWTPTLSASYGSFPTAITNAEGVYTKIGDVVHCRFKFNSSSATNVVLNDRALLLGLPFVPKDLNSFDGSGTAFQYRSVGTGGNAFWSVITEGSSRFLVNNTSVIEGIGYVRYISGVFTYTIS